MTLDRILRAVTVGNFKAFEDVQRLPLKPITLIYGPNSSGKSTLVQALALVHEAEFGVGSDGRSSLDVHHTLLGGSAVDLGGFRQYVHRGQASLRVRWGAELDAAALGRRDERLGQLLAHASKVTFNVSIGIEVDDRDRPRFGAEPRVEEIDVIVDGDELVRMSRRPSTEPEDAPTAKFRIDRLATDHRVFAGTLTEALAQSDVAGDPDGGRQDLLSRAVAAFVPSLVVQSGGLLPTDAVVSVEEPVLIRVAKHPLLTSLGGTFPIALQQLLNGIGRALRDEIGTLRYLGPLRSLPPRNIASSQHGDPNRVAGGAWAWDEVRQVSAVRDAVNAWLGSDRLKTPYELKVRSLASVDGIAQAIEGVLLEEQYDVDGTAAPLTPWSDMDHTADSGPVGGSDASGGLAAKLANAIADPRLERFRELVLLDKRRNAMVTHRDVGVGISQVLPVLVMCYGSVGRTLAMEQPEIHLHPGLQAELGDVLIEAALSERRNTLLVETHSEHLLLRIQRRIREDQSGSRGGHPRITADDVAVLYVEPYESRSVVREMPLTASGELAKAWPGGFFEEGLREQLDA